MLLPDFRIAFPQFASSPDATVDALLAQAGIWLSAEMWGDVLDIGTGLYVAHFLQLGINSQANGGASQKTATGLLASKSVDVVSASMDFSYTTNLKAGQWNLTGYGQQFYYWANLIASQASGQFWGG